MSEGYGKGGSGFGLTRDQSVEMIVRTCIDNGITDHRQIAYVLATAQHESRDFAAPEEDWQEAGGGSALLRRRGVLRPGLCPPHPRQQLRAAGRGAGDRPRAGRASGTAAQADIATKVLVVGMRDGLFGARLSDNVNANHADYRQARASVNGGELNNGSPYPDAIATRATEWESQVAGLVQRAATRLPDAGADPQAPTGAMDLHRVTPTSTCWKRSSTCSAWTSATTPMPRSSPTVISAPPPSRPCAASRPSGISPAMAASTRCWNACAATRWRSIRTSSAGR